MSMNRVVEEIRAAIPESYAKTVTAQVSENDPNIIDVQLDDGQYACIAKVHVPEEMQFGCDFKENMSTTVKAVIEALQKSVYDTRASQMLAAAKNN